LNIIRTLKEKTSSILDDNYYDTQGKSIIIDKQNTIEKFKELNI